jgi:leucyl aminopeptidase
MGNREPVEGREDRYTGISDEMWKQVLFKGENMGKCRGYARTLGNLPNNYLHTEDLVRYAEDLAKNLGVFCRTFRNRELEELNCSGLLAVNQGSGREANGLGWWKKAPEPAGAASLL